MAVANASQKGLSVADPNAKYESIKELWKKSRAICSGERFVKDYDALLDKTLFRNMLIPFSPSMTQEQYNFYRAEAELPGIVSQYARILIGGLLRKQPQLALPEDAPTEARSWILNSFGQDNSPMVSFLDTALWEEIQTSRSWVHVDYPTVENSEELVDEDFKKISPYPLLWQAETIINWRTTTNPVDGSQQLSQLIRREYEESHVEGEFHPKLLDTVWVHELVDGFYQIRKYQKSAEDSVVPVANGKVQKDFKAGGSGDFLLVATITAIMAHGVRLTQIPAWPLNGSIEPVEPILTALVDREVSLYNKVSRRNHLLYGAATYTPVVSSDMSDDDFEQIVASGLGSWIHLAQGDTATILDTPTDALVDMDRAISNTLEELAKLGIRMLAPESAQSGVALEIRNAAQTAQLGTLNTKISSQMASIIAFMINWRYGTDYTADDIEFNLSADFNPAPLGADWLRLVTEWYESNLIPRSSWLQILKQNDILAADYDDEHGKSEILEDEFSEDVTKDNLDTADELLKEPKND